MIDRKRAIAILRKNDRGGYTMPTDGLYPFQWSWDSAITALGWLQVDEARAWDEAHTMFRGQWPNGMLPHILFHKDAESYFPGPDVWGSREAIPSSAISQPPVWATAIRFLYERSIDRKAADRALRQLLPGLIAYHRWWYRERDPEGNGLVSSYHPWESGMDNSPAWDKPLGNVPAIDWSYQRRDLSHVESEQRPKKQEYDRYLYLVDFYKQQNFDSKKIYRESPYKVIDVGIVAILHRATADLLALCAQASLDEDSAFLESAMAHTEDAIGTLWSDQASCFFSVDQLTGLPLDVVTTGTVLPLFARLANTGQAGAMARLIEGWLDASGFGLASTHPDSPLFEPQRYWRGPVWLHINWMIADGLAHYGEGVLSERLKQASQRCIDIGGFWEYFDADTGAGCGGDDFSWTAAIAMHWLDG